MIFLVDLAKPPSTVFSTWRMLSTPAGWTAVDSWDRFGAVPVLLDVNLVVSTKAFFKGFESRFLGLAQAPPPADMKSKFCTHTWQHLLPFYRFIPKNPQWMPWDTDKIGYWRTNKAPRSQTHIYELTFLPFYITLQFNVINLDCLNKLNDSYHTYKYIYSSTQIYIDTQWYTSRPT